MDFFTSTRSVPPPPPLPTAPGASANNAAIAAPGPPVFRMQRPPGAAPRPFFPAPDREGMPGAPRPGTAGGPGPMGMMPAAQGMFAFRPSMGMGIGSVGAVGPPQGLARPRASTFFHHADATPSADQHQQQALAVPPTSDGLVSPTPPPPPPAQQPAPSQGPARTPSPEREHRDFPSPALTNRVGPAIRNLWPAPGGPVPLPPQFGKRDRPVTANSSPAGAPSMLHGMSQGLPTPETSPMDLDRAAPPLKRLLQDDGFQRPPMPMLLPPPSRRTTATLPPSQLGANVIDAATAAGHEMASEAVQAARPSTQQGQYPAPRSAAMAPVTESASMQMEQRLDAVRDRGVTARLESTARAVSTTLQDLAHLSRDLNGRQQQYEAEVARLEPMQAELDDWMLDVRGLHASSLRAFAELVTSPSPRFLHSLEDLARARQRIAALNARRPIVVVPAAEGEMAA